MNTYKVTAGNDESSQKEIGHVESWNLDSAIGSAQFHFRSELSRSKYWGLGWCRTQRWAAS